MWLYGAAGSGKSAIAQTLAESCFKKGLLLGAFFFSRTDPTRSRVTPVVATIAYQLATSNPAARTSVEAALLRNPMILDQTIKAQLTELVIRPLSDHTRIASRLIIIDGLDECSNAHLQCQLLLECVEALRLNNNLDLRILIASRPEQHLRMTFNSLVPKLLLSRLALSDHYSASKDIRVFLQSKFEWLKTHHPMRYVIPSSWPGDRTVENLVTKSSGQFIYASLVIKYISPICHRPTDRLDTILGIRPPVQQRDTPFAELDALYTHLLSLVNDAKTLLRVLRFIFSTHSQYPFFFAISCGAHSPSCWTPGIHTYQIERIFSLEPGDILLCLNPLSSIIEYNELGGITVHHASIADFLLDPHRSRTFYLDLDSLAVDLACSCFRYIKLNKGTIPHINDN